MGTTNKAATMARMAATELVRSGQLLHVACSKKRPSGQNSHLRQGTRWYPCWALEWHACKNKIRSGGLLTMGRKPPRRNSHCHDLQSRRHQDTYCF
eukprot:1405494-Prymnesium_polylepis.1